MRKVGYGVVVHLGKGSMTLLTILGLVLLSLISPTVVVRILENLHEIAQERNYLVDYDIPARPGYESRRVTFYHTKKKLISEAM